jgi:hypothetical protein
MKSLLPAVKQYQQLATKHGIGDIFQDNGGKVLELLLTLGLQGIPGRNGNDAVDAAGNEYEVKTTNLDNASPAFTTNHHLNLDILRKYRMCDWIFATYVGIEMREVYQVAPKDLEARYFSKWEKRLLAGADHLNNPKIAISHVRSVGNKLV